MQTVSVSALNAPVFGLECAFLRFCAFKAENGRIQGRVLTGTQALLRCYNIQQRNRSYKNKTLSSDTDRVYVSYDNMMYSPM